MKTDALSALTSQLARAPASLTIADAGADFGAKLTLGQIIKGRVLRSYDGNRHLVDFGGRERVVDSSVLLRPGEVFQGRVVGLGERVELQKLPAGAGEPAPPGAAPDDRNIGARGDTLVRDLFARYGAAADAQTLAALQQIVGRRPDASAAALAGLVLAKQGLPIAADWVRLLQTRLGAVADAPTGGTALHLQTVPAAMVPAADAAPAPEPLVESAATPAATIPALGLVLQDLLMTLPKAPLPVRDEKVAGSEANGEVVADPAANGGMATGGMATGPFATANGAPMNGTFGGSERRGDGPSAPALADWILNGQTPGPIAHRLGRLPLVVDGRLLELEIAVFEEAGRRDGSSSEGDDATRHRQIVLSLDTPGLGRVDVEARLAGQHLQVRLATASSESTAALALHSHRLEQALRGLGWALDGLAYETRTGTGGQAGEPVTGPRGAVVEHIVNPGSVSRLV